jgi:cob(I)alamin adenosyltransferase
MTENENPPVSTRRGDDGTTTLLGAGRLSKGDPRVVVLGDVDEASSAIGLARAESEGDMADLLIGLQRLLYRVMGDVAMPGEENSVGAADVEYADAALEEWRNRTEIPNQFVVPGESRLGALLDVARSVTRRAERALVAAGYANEHPDAVKCVNRLSDVLFVAARNADGKYALSRE